MSKISKKAKKVLFSVGAAAAVIVLLLYGRRLSLLYSYTDPLAALYKAEAVNLKEQPANLSQADWDAAGVAQYHYEGQLVSAEGEIVPFRIRGKKDACRAALACADLIGLPDCYSLRYSYSDSNVYDSIAPLWLGWHYYAFVQYYGDIPVYGGSVIVQAERFGKPAGLMTNLLQEIPDQLPAEPQITEEQARRAAAKAFLSEPSQKQKPVVAVAADADGRPILAWIVPFDDGSDNAVVDALTGEAVKQDASDNSPATAE